MKNIRVDLTFGKQALTKQPTVKILQSGPLQHLVQVLLETKTILQLEILFLTCVKHHPATQWEISGWQTSVSIQVNRLKQVKNCSEKMVQLNFFYWRFNKRNIPCSPHRRGNADIFHKKGCLGFWNTSVFISVNGKEASGKYFTTFLKISQRKCQLTWWWLALWSSETLGNQLSGRCHCKSWNFNQL